MSFFPSPLVARALEQRRLERATAQVEKPLERRRLAKNRGTKLATERRRYAPAKVGDTFGTFRVVRLADRDHTSNERVEVECPNGHRRVAYVFNLRRGPTCRACRRAP